ncbi:Uncharacterised protein [Mycoplasma putrefaciens]|uniref:Uncharacterized protein n=1 Tax=Mycoplasma putrefaciens (strain ATCC 15718 / NCTC 10155 / C30 KS-1 / KS-1) TaxID=743965 RepID=A0A7U3ZST5_MYCPK|nr:hypothetical protein [Mycoplasma putrefaciens]AEM68887.1 hypothetical protein MPUT_0532 [Mycoplasma putrefaciens KS1]SYV96275.1 Uncharacterised protein [Mycoplasma putrefaciens]
MAKDNITVRNKYLAKRLHCLISTIKKLKREIKQSYLLGTTIRTSHRNLNKRN